MTQAPADWEVVRGFLQHALHHARSLRGYEQTVAVNKVTAAIQSLDRLQIKGRRRVKANEGRVHA